MTKNSLFSLKPLRHKGGTHFWTFCRFCHFFETNQMKASSRAHKRFRSQGHGLRRSLHSDKSLILSWGVLLGGWKFKGMFSLKFQRKSSENRGSKVRGLFEVLPGMVKLLKNMICWGNSSRDNLELIFRIVISENYVPGFACEDRILLYRE